MWVLPFRIPKYSKCKRIIKRKSKLHSKAGEKTHSIPEQTSKHPINSPITNFFQLLVDESRNLRHHNLGMILCDTTRVQYIWKGWKYNSVRYQESNIIFSGRYLDSLTRLESRAAPGSLSISNSCSACTLPHDSPMIWRKPGVI